MRILLVDDQNEIRLLTAHQLQQDGHSVVAASDGVEALAQFDRSPFDIVLLDEQMPGPSGIEVLHAIRANQAGNRQIVVALTGYNTEPDRQRLLREGFDSVIGKPFRLDRLQAALLALLNSRDSSGHVQPETDTGPTGLQDTLKSVGGDKKLLYRMIRTFLDDTPKRLAQIETAILRHRPEVLASVAHALKGSVAIFGATAAHRYCQELQELGHRRELSRASRVLELLKEEIAKVEANLRGYAGQTSLSGSGVPQKQKRKRPGSAAKRKPR
jgi:two-component system sensor histidine kinase/response regulator